MDLSSPLAMEFLRHSTNTAFSSSDSCITTLRLVMLIKMHATRSSLPEFPALLVVFALVVAQSQ